MKIKNYNQKVSSLKIPNRPNQMCLCNLIIDTKKLVNSEFDNYKKIIV